MLALVTALAADGLDPDLEPVRSALAADGVDVEVVSWDDRLIDWGRFDAAILRSTWDYAERIDEFRGWLDVVVQRTRLVNPIGAVRWNLDKHYLLDLAEEGIAIVPTTFVELNAPLPELDPAVDVFVVKPAIGAGSIGARRCVRAEVAEHVDLLHGAGFVAMVQPYVDMIDVAAETSLVYLGDGTRMVYDHAFSKQAILTSTDVEQNGGLMAKEEIGVREGSAAERALGDAIVSSALVRSFGPLAYARVDVVPTPTGPVLMELELIEPSLCFNWSPGSAERAARAWQSFLAP